MLTAIGEVWAFNTTFFPVAAAEEADIVDEAFRFLTILGVPVATLVLTMLGYSFVRFRAGRDTQEEGPPLRKHQPIALGWFVVTTALAVFVVFNPGLKGLNELNANPNAELTVQIEGEQWHWNVAYPQYDLSYKRALQIALPVDTRVRFELSSRDVIHSFWIPAFRLKQDALPGRTTEMYLTPTETGTFEDDPAMRVQCAELCGTGHAWMRMSVLVLELEEFDQWVKQARELTVSGEMNMDMGGMDMGDDSAADMDMNMEGTEEPHDDDHN